ncbi:MAG: class I SAM-dependent methyltransferase [Acidimicrobiia bacterium]
MDQNEWNERYRATELVWSAEPNRFVVAEVADLEPGRVLDLAAGEGRNAIWLAEQGWRAAAIDYSDVALDKARDLAARRGVEIDTALEDVTRFRPSPGAYDLVLVAYLQLPEPDRSAALRRAVDAVAPGGTLLVIAHDESNVERGYGGPKDPAVLASPDEVASIVSELEVVKAERVERAVDTPDGPRVAIDHVVRARRPA